MRYFYRESGQISGTILGIGITSVFFILLIILGFSRAQTLELPNSLSHQRQITEFPLILSLTPLLEPKKRVLLKELVPSSGVLVNFWATWCAPCLEELPSLEILGRQLKNKPNLPQLITISEDEKLEDISLFLKSLSFNLSIPIYYDTDGAAAISVGTEKFPETYWIGTNGKILHKWIGPQDWMSQDILTTIGAAP